jgi:broad specificity phosphatase PhoE
MNIFVVRHGQTEWNVLKKMQGSADIELNEKGLLQANDTAEMLKDLTFDIIFCSPLKRAKQTAEIINNDRNLNIIFDDRIKERNYGEFEGTSKLSFDYNEFWAYTKNTNYEKAENVQEFFKRVYSFLDEITSKEYENVLIVCHAGVEKAIECYFNGLMSDDEIGPFLPDNASVLKYSK